MIDPLGPPLPPCRHCSLAVEYRADAQWWHVSTNSTRCSPVSRHTFAEPDPRYISETLPIQLGFDFNGTTA